MTRYKSTDPNPDFAKLSDEVLDQWEHDHVFEQSVESRSADNEFIFFDGPPFANGSPHYGHLLTGFAKDSVARYQTLKGRRVKRKFGWDCHGLPVELEVEKAVGVSGRLGVMEFGIDRFNELCRKSVMKTADDWAELVKRQARWVDMKNAYRTMDLSYMESVIWSFKQLYDKGLIYKARRVMPYSWACQTPLSNFETRLDNSYKDVVDRAITVKFFSASHNAYFIAWTTTPWTLPSNLALVVNPDALYAFVKSGNETFIVANFASEHYFPDGEVTKLVKGQSLVGQEYEPIFPYFASTPGAFRVLPGTFVTTSDGTGIVHAAPAFGEEDLEICSEFGIEPVCPVDDAGRFTEVVTDFSGVRVFDANSDIIKWLKERNRWIKTEQYRHRYPHCWRTDTPLIYKAISSWYVRVTAIKDQMLSVNEQINWIPDHIQHGLFGKWLDGARDWSISRNRFWGTPLPIWESDDPTYPRVDVYGSIAELERDFGVKIEDLHRPFVDTLTRPNPDDPTGKSMMRRVPEVLDCWFDSGAMPYAQLHYPFENKQCFESHVSADFVVEYVAQTRGWFYTMTVLSTALFNKPPFLNAICHGVILDTNGQKLSKRLKNYPDPNDVFDKYGSDALRFALLSSVVMRGCEFNIDADGRMVAETLRLVIKPIWNALNFFTLYANADDIAADLITHSGDSSDIYVFSKLKDALARIDNCMSAYNFPSACDTFTEFVDALNNWYIRRNRHRFWSQDKQDSSKKAAYDTLYTILHHLSIAASPLLPIVLERVYTTIVPGGSSVHLQNYPDYSQLPYDVQIVEQIDLVRAVCASALNLRNESQIRVRQPLSELVVIGIDSTKLEPHVQLIIDEVNVKAVRFVEIEQSQTQFKLKLNFRLLGFRLAHKMKEILEAIDSGDWAVIDDQRVLIEDEILSGEEFELVPLPSDEQSVAVVDGSNGFVALNTILTPELISEGAARDIVRLVQQMRKSAGLNVSDRIELEVETTDNATEVIAKHMDYIATQVLATSIKIGSRSQTFLQEDECEVLGSKLTLRLVAVA